MNASLASAFRRTSARIRVSNRRLRSLTLRDFGQAKEGLPAKKHKTGRLGLVRSNIEFGRVRPGYLQPGKESRAMLMQDALVRIKAFLKPARLPALVQDYFIRLVAAFVAHLGRMSASQMAEAIKSEARHRAQVTRFLAKLRWSPDWTRCLWMATLLLEQERKRGGRWLFIVDQTYCGQQGQKTENTFSRANYRSRPKKSKRRQKKHAKRSCHCFVAGLLLTPGGLRLPVFKSYYAKTYCEAKKLPQRTQTELAAELIRELAVPTTAEVVVLGDTAFDAQS